MTRRSWDRRRATALATLASAAVWFVLLQPTTGIAEEMVIGSIDLYGLRKVSESDIRKALGFEVGGPGPVSESEVIERLESVPGVARADLEGICCEEDGTILVYVGIEETPASKREYRPDPVSEVELPAEIAETYQEFFDAFEKAILKGDAGDDLSQGHSLMNNPAVRRVQEQFIVLADKHLEKLREALHNSADASERAMAGMILGYATDKRAVVDDLLDAARDSNAAVRNQSIRSLGAIASLAQQKPELGIRIDATMFIDMLDSLTWSDRNKAMMVLGELTTDRDPAVLQQLLERAGPSLVEMARWSSLGHAGAALILLGRAVGMPEEEIQQAFASGDRERIIAKFADFERLNE